MTDALRETLEKLRAGESPCCPGCGAKPSEWSTANCFLWECSSGAYRNWLRDGEYVIHDDAIKFSPECYKRQLAQCAAEIERLKAGMLFTADGAPIAHGMRLWPLHEIEGERGSVVTFTLYDYEAGELLLHNDECDVTKCYSSRDAARAALGGGK